MKGRSAVLRYARRVMLTPYFLARYHCEFSKGFRDHRTVDVRLLTKAIGIMVEGRR